MARIDLQAALGIVALLLSLGLGCSGVLRAPSGYNYFSRPASNDAWSGKISNWQRRELSSDGGAALVEGIDVASETPAARPADDPLDGGLRSKYFLFRAEHKRAMARDLAQWIQGQAKAHYIADGPIDHWATLEETLSTDGDDCDGLELLVYHALRDLGFDPREVYRAIVYRPSDGQHHMVTLWFEERDDPWVIDPTGAMVQSMRRMSELPAWVPLKVFSSTSEYTVQRDALPSPSPNLAANP